VSIPIIARRYLAFRFPSAWSIPLIAPLSNVSFSISNRVYSSVMSIDLCSHASSASSPISSIISLLLSLSFCSQSNNRTNLQHSFASFPFSFPFLPLPSDDGFVSLSDCWLVFLILKPPYSLCFLINATTSLLFSNVSVIEYVPGQRLDDEQIQEICDHGRQIAAQPRPDGVVLDFKMAVILAIMVRAPGHQMDEELCEQVYNEVMEFEVGRLLVESLLSPPTAPPA